MTNHISLNNKEFQFTESFLPCLVIGADGSGASYFSISLIAKLIQQGSKVIFFTAFPMAKEELLYQIGDKQLFDITTTSDIKHAPHDKSIIIQSGNQVLWQTVIQGLPHIEEYIIFVKNIEEYDVSLLEVIDQHQKLLLSGNLDVCSFKKELAQKHWESKILFTAPDIDLQVVMPTLEKHEAYLTGNNTEGIVRLKKDE